MSIMDRQARIIRLRNEGRSLKEIGEAVGLTSERVRQLLAADGLKTMKADEHITRAIAGWRASGELRHPSDVAKEYGLPDNAATRAKLRRGCPELTMPTVNQHGSRWNAQDIAEIMKRIAAEQGITRATGWITVGEYAEWRGEDDPSTATIGSNYLWGDIMSLAGFNPANATKRGRRLGEGFTEFTDEELDKAVLLYLDSRPEKLSAADMEAFLGKQGDQPSIATIRNRFRRRGVGSISGIFADVIERCRPEV